MDVEEGEWDRGVVDSEEIIFAGRRICEGGRGMGRAVACRVGCAPLVVGGMWMELEGELEVKLERRCVGCERGSVCWIPMRLSTGRPSCRR